MAASFLNPKWAPGNVVKIKQQDVWVCGGRNGTPQLWLSPAVSPGVGKLEGPAAVAGASYGHDGRTPQEQQELLWQDFFSDPAQWWDCRQAKRSPRHPDFRHKASRKALWVDNPRNPGWLHAQLAAWDEQGHAGTSSGTGSRPGHWTHGEDMSEVDICRRLCDKGQLGEAIEALDLLVQRGLRFDTGLLYSVLKRCIAQRDLHHGKRVHVLSVRSGKETDRFLGNHIIRMYASHGLLEDAVNVFSRIAAPNTFAWASIIKAHADHGQPAEAVKLYRQMRRSTMEPNNHIFVAVLKACALAGDLASGKEVHTDILESSHEPDMFVGSSLLDMYAKCGSLEDARAVFDDLPVKDVVTWTAMIAGYAQHGRGQEALDLYASMQHNGLLPANHVTFVSLLKACAVVGALHQGMQLHSLIRKRGLENDVVIGSCLVDMYAKCGNLEDARKVFDNLPTRSVVTWNAMFAGYAQHSLGQEAIDLYASMQQEGKTLPDRVTFVCLLKACASVRALHQGKQLHSRIQERVLHTDMVVGSCLVDMYAKCGDIELARRVFDELPRRDVVTWSAMIGGYASHGRGHDALDLYAVMQEDGVDPANHITFVSLLKACAIAGALQQGKQLHLQLEQRGLETDLVIGNCLVDMYARCGSLEDARRVFDRLSCRDVVAWNAILGGYCQQGLGQDALDLYASMQQEVLSVGNHVTFVWLLNACASIGGLHQGKQLHDVIQDKGLDSDVVVGNCLVDMYAKCGSLEGARRVFETLAVKDVVTWNSLLNGYAKHGDGHRAIQFFEEMREESVEPNGATFISLLVACSHKGLVKEGQRYFGMMEEQGIEPTDQHHNCMIDLLGRSGNLEGAEKLLQSVPFENDVVGWTSLLSACKSHGDVERGRRCFERLVRLEPQTAAAYVLLGNIYANAGMWSDAEEIERLRKCAGAWKKPAKAGIEVNNKMHEFTVGDERRDVASKLLSMNVRVQDEGGHVPLTELVLKAVSESEKEDALCGHAEKLALAYGLLNTPEGTTLVVTKNLRMCNDCHSATKIMSHLEQRQIIVRDAHRVHCFVDGSCSCGDWH